MEDWDSKLDVFLRFNDAEILQDKIQNEVIALPAEIINGAAAVVWIYRIKACFKSMWKILLRVCHTVYSD